MAKESKNPHFSRYIKTRSIIRGQQQQQHFIIVSSGIICLLDLRTYIHTHNTLNDTSPSSSSSRSQRIDNQLVIHSVMMKDYLCFSGMNQSSSTLHPHPPLYSRLLTRSSGLNMPWKEKKKQESSHKTTRIAGNTNLGTAQNGVLGRVVRVVLGGDLQHRGNGSGVRVDNVTDQLGQVLVDQDDVDVVALNEPLEAVLQLAHGRVCGIEGDG